RDGALRRPGRVQRRKVGWRVTPLAFVPAAGRGRGRRSATSSTKMVGTARCAVRAAFSGATSDVRARIRSGRCTRPGTSQRDVLHQMVGMARYAVRAAFSGATSDGG